MTKVSELSPEQGVELALTVLLEKGFEDTYYSSWQEYCKENYSYEDEDLDYRLCEWAGVWETMLESVPKNTTFITDDGVSVEWVATQSDGDWQDRDSYFVVFKLTDDSATKYFMQEGYYHSYDGGHLEEGTSKEVNPKEQTVMVWRS